MTVNGRALLSVQTSIPTVRAPDLIVTAESMVWRQVIAKTRNAAAAFASGAMSLEVSASLRAVLTPYVLLIDFVCGQGGGLTGIVTFTQFMMMFVPD